MSPRWRGGLGGFALYLTLAFSGGVRADDMAELKDCLSRLHQAEAKFLTHVPAVLLTLDGNLVRIAQGVQYIDENAKTLEHNLAANPQDPVYGLLAANAVEGCRGYLELFDSRLRFYLIFIGCLLFTGVVLTLTLGFNMVPVNRGGPRRGTKRKRDLSSNLEVDRHPADKRR